MNKTLLRIIKELRFFTKNEIENLLKEYGYSKNYLKKLTKKGILISKKMFGEIIYIANLKKIDELLK